MIIYDRGSDRDSKWDRGCEIASLEVKLPLFIVLQCPPCVSHQGICFPGLTLAGCFLAPLAPRPQKRLVNEQASNPARLQRLRPYATHPRDTPETLRRTHTHGKHVSRHSSQGAHSQIETQQNLCHCSSITAKT